MRWQHVRENWRAFYDAIQSRWPEVDFDSLDGIEGDPQAFRHYIATIGGLSQDEAADEIREWLAGEVPADVVMHPRHDNRSITMSGKYVSPGEDESDDDARFGDDDQIRGDGDRTGRGPG